MSVTAKRLTTVLRSGTATALPLTISGLWGWWDTSDTSTLKQDSAGTTAVTATSDPVGYWGDKSGNSRAFIQSGAGTLKPTYQGTNAGISFDGGDYLTLYSQSTTFTAQTVIAVVNLSASGAVGARVFNQVAASSDDYGATGHYIPLRRADSLTSIGAFAGGGARATVTNANGVKSLLVARHSGTAIVNRINGVDGSSYSHTLNYTPQRMRLMSNLGAANDNGGETGVGTYYELLVFSTALSTTDRAALETYLNAKWSIY